MEPRRAVAAILLLQFIILSTIICQTSSSLAKGRVIMCYWGSWSIYKPGNGAYDTSKINTGLCSHIVYLVAGMRGENTASPYTIYSYDPWADLSPCEGGNFNNYANAVGLRKKDPTLKVLLGIGGRDMGSVIFSNMTLDATRRQTFIASVVKFLLRYDFDGLDLEWQYPTARGGRPEDKPNFTLLVKELRVAFDGVVREPGRDKLLLTAALPGRLDLLENGYELKEISKYLNYVNLMSYDLHTFDDGPFLYHHAGMDKTNLPQDVGAINNIKSAVEYMLAKEVPPKQLVLGVSTCSKGFELENPSLTGFFDPAVRPTPAFTYSAEAGTLFYYETCSWITNENATIVRDPAVVAPYTFNDKYWIAYDDPESIMSKAQYAVSKGLGGAMVSSIEGDDFRNNCEGISANPLTTTIRMVFETSPTLPSG